MPADEEELNMALEDGVVFEELLAPVGLKDGKLECSVMKLGESAEETARREIAEEIGLEVNELQFIRSYPYEKKEMLMLGFHASVKKADFRISREVDAVEWFPLSTAMDRLRPGSIAWELVKTVKENLCSAL